ncbi:hypothetical protein D3C72_1692750 [compost metagenome]
MATTSDLSCSLILLMMGLKSVMAGSNECVVTFTPLAARAFSTSFARPVVASLVEYTMETDLAPTSCSNPSMAFS